MWLQEVNFRSIFIRRLFFFLAIFQIEFIQAQIIIGALSVPVHKATLVRIYSPAVIVKTTQLVPSNLEVTIFQDILH